MSKINIKGEEYAFDFVDPNTHKDSDWDGLCKKFEREIFINKDLTIRPKLITMLHEWGHALLHEVSADDNLSPDMEEIIVDNYAKELYKVMFLDNDFKHLMLSTVDKYNKQLKKAKKKNGRK